MVNLFLILLYGVMGGVAIRFAITEFKNERYFLFGVWAMVVLEYALYMAKAIFAM